MKTPFNIDKPEMKKKIVYFAGKIKADEQSGNYYADWRNDILNDESHKKYSFPSRDDLFFEYGGPNYFREHGFLYDGVETHRDAYINNIKHIEYCDVMFVYLDSNDSYGTIAEIGYARGIGKEIFIYYTSNVDKDQFRFVFSFANKVTEVENHTEGWKIFEKEVLKYVDYKDYLQSKYWKDLSKECKNDAGNKCILCAGEKSLNVHHRSYEHLGNKDKEKKDLVVLCKKCHSKFHDKFIG